MNLVNNILNIIQKLKIMIETIEQKLLICQNHNKEPTVQTNEIK